MPILTRDFKKILDIVEIIYAIADRASMFRACCEEMQKLIPFPSAVLIINDPKSGNYLLQNSHTYNVPDYALISFCHYYAQLSPLSQARHLFEKMNIQCAKITDVISPSRFIDTEYCRDFLTPLNHFYNLLMKLKSSRGVFSSIGLSRSRNDHDFTDRDLEIINILIPHLSRALQNIDSDQRGVATNGDIMSKLKRFDLSIRQREVAIHVMKGLTNCEIGRRLFIAEQTVKDHVFAIFEKVGVRKRSELTAKIMGLTTLEGPPE